MFDRAMERRPTVSNPVVPSDSEVLELESTVRVDLLFGDASSKPVHFLLYTVHCTPYLFWGFPEPPLTHSFASP